MSDLNTTFCQALLREARADAKKAGIRVPRISTYRCNSLSQNRWYEVWSKDQGLVWQGAADNGWHAKALYIESLLENLEKVES